MEIEPAALEKIAESLLPTRFASFRIEVYRSEDTKEHVVISLGDLAGEPPLVRVHSECLTGDALFSLRCDCGFQLHAALEKIAAAGRGAILYLRQEGRGIGLGNKIRAYALQDQGTDTVDANHQLGFPADAREYGLAVQLLKQRGLYRIRLMTNNPRKFDALNRDGIEVVERVPVESGRNPYNEAYLNAKADKLGHWLTRGLMEPAQAPAGESRRGVLRELGSLTVSTYRVSRDFAPLLRLLGNDADLSRSELAIAIDQAFAGLYRHPLTHSATRVTRYLRSRRLIPNEQSTEELLRYLVGQLVARSPVPVPEQLIAEFWQFFEELFASQELKGLGELSLDMVRLVLRTYEPQLVEIANLLKAGRRYNEWQLKEILRRTDLIRQDLVIVRRQIKALRYIKPFFAADPRDLRGQAQLIAQMVREFGPFFIKMAQAAAANADFLPAEIARELAVFHEDVPAMSEAEVEAAFLECHGKRPHQLYMDFDAARPVRSGSIGSVYVAKKPFMHEGAEILRTVVIKVGRQNIDREFAIGKLVLGLAIMSSQYWAPHSRLTPFLRAMQEQVDEFVAGFVEELDFDAEARNHLRFRERSLHSRLWRVPALYGHTHRIIEMEYLSDASSPTRALARMGRRERRRLQTQLSERLLYAVLQHIVVYREIHGDLHPGNIMVGADGGLHLIDWGNVVSLDGKWGKVWNYLAGAVLADVGLLGDTLIEMSTQPEANRLRRVEIRAALQQTLAKKGITPLTARNFIAELRHGGRQGLHQRGQAALHLMSNTQQLGLVLRRDYLHLSRALFAAAGSFGSLYEDDPARLLLRDLGRSLLRLPVNFGQDLWHQELSGWRARALRRLPPVLRSRFHPAAALTH